MIAQNLLKGNQNVVDIYKKSFDLLLDYEVLIQSKNFCFPSALIDVSNVSFCRNIAKLTFDVPCLDSGEYTMTIRDKNDQDNVILNQNALI